MASISFVPDVEDVFALLQRRDVDGEIPLVEEDRALTSQAVAYLKSKGAKFGKIYWTKSQKELVNRTKAVFLTAYSALAFLKVGNAIRNKDLQLRTVPQAFKCRFCTEFDAERLSEIYSKIHPNSRQAMVIAPSCADLEKYSNAWQDLPQFTKNLTSGFNKIRELIEADGLEPLFHYALDLYKFTQDPDLNTKTPQMLKDEYPVLQKLGIDLERLKERVVVLGRENFLACSQDLIQDSNIIKGVHLLQFAFEQAPRQDSDTFLKNLVMLSHHLDSRLAESYIKQDNPANRLEVQKTKLKIQSAKEKIREILKDESAFQAADDLYKLARDPYLGEMTFETFKETYRSLFKQGVDFSILKERLLKAGLEAFPACAQDLISNRQIIKGALLFHAAFSHLAQEESLYWIANTFESIQTKVFSHFSQDQQEMILKLSSASDEAIEENSEAFQAFLEFGAVLDKEFSLIPEIDSFNESLLTDVQKRLLENRNPLIERTHSMLQRFIEKLIQEPIELDSVAIYEMVKPYALQRDEDGITEQFKKDGHRYGSLVLADASGATLYPGNNYADFPGVKDAILAQLKIFATLNGEFNEDLFALLQEAVCQNLEKAGTQQALYAELIKRLGPNLGAVLPVSWRKKCMKLERTDATTFMASQEYNVSIMDPVANKIIEFIVRAEHSMNSTGIIKSKRFCVPNEAAPLITIGNPVPLAPIADELVILIDSSTSSSPSPSSPDEED